MICENFGTLHLIDWGLSKKRNSVYPDIASCAIGIFNDYPDYYKLFLKNFFKDVSKIDFKMIEKCLKELYTEFKLIRMENNFEINSLDQQFEKAKNVINSVRMEMKGEF